MAVARWDLLAATAIAAPGDDEQEGGGSGLDPGEVRFGPAGGRGRQLPAQLEAEGGALVASAPRVARVGCKAIRHRLSLIAGRVEQLEAG